MTACSPLIVGNRIFIITGNGVDEGHVNLPSPDAPSFIGLDKKTGKLLWKNNLPGKNIMHGQWSSPAYGVFKRVETVIFPGGDGWIYGLKPDTGEMIWKFDANPKTAKYELGGRSPKSDFMGMPVVYKDRIFIGAGQDPEHFEGIGHFWCFDPASKTGDISAEVIADDKVYPAKTKPNPNSGAVWHYGGEEKRQHARRDYVFSRTISTACIVDDIIYIPDIGGFLHCLDAKTGKRFWEYDLKSNVWGSAYFADGKVFLGTEDGEVWIFRHDPKPETLDPTEHASMQKDAKAARIADTAIQKLIKQKYLLAKIEMDECIRGTPSVANGVLYIATERTLYAIAAEKKK
jgi:outer membrane protein assembly factor BamB